jgi:exoribonuclease-2
VRREQLVKIDHLPLMLRVPSLPGDLPPGQRVHLSIESIDEFAPELTCRFLNLIGEAAPVVLADVLEAEAGDAEEAGEVEGQ